MTRGDLDARVEVRGSDELADLSRAFNTMAGQLAETERLRRQLVSDVAHELRSPVTNLRCTLEAIQDGLVEANRHSVDDLHEETLFLQRMIADLEDLALADAGGLVIHREPVDLAAVLQRAVATAGAHGTGGRITVEGSSTPVVVTGDRDRLEQVFRNLLLNARTHTAPDGSITVKVVSDADVVAVALHDDGRGIRPDDLPHVFDRFYRADRSRTRATGGAGLGLAIARQLVLAHGGAIAAASDGEGRGAIFTVRLPRTSR
jgi:two-component system sensor histidine kinase BaeS